MEEGGAAKAAMSTRSGSSSVRSSAASGAGAGSTAIVPASSVVGTPEEVAAANRIIGLYRIRAARRRLRQVLKGVYAKYFDESSGFYYYYNEKTGETAWQKPALLGGEDIVAVGEEDEAKSDDGFPPGSRPRGRHVCAAGATRRSVVTERSRSVTLPVHCAAGECLCIPNNAAEQERAAKALFQTNGGLVCRCLRQRGRLSLWQRDVDSAHGPDSCTQRATPLPLHC